MTAREENYKEILKLDFKYLIKDPGGLGKSHFVIDECGNTPAVA